MRFLLVITFVAAEMSALAAGEIKFRVHEIGRPGGNNFGQTSAADVDHDGDLDLVQAEGDVLDGRVAWFENRHSGADWEPHLIKSPGHNQDFHSLCVADFDNDGDVDIFSGGGPLTQGELQWFLWENADGRGSIWKEHLIERGRRTHQSVCGDVDGDGDIDIITKPWNGDLHLFVENLCEHRQRKTANALRTVLGVDGMQFTLNGKPEFLLGASYYGGLGASDDARRADFDKLQERGFNWVRVWATWAAFGNDLSAVEPITGEPRQPYLQTLQNLVRDCDRRGMVVDVTLSRGKTEAAPTRLPNHESHRQAVRTLVEVLKPYRNWYLDLSNERNIGDSRHTSIEELSALREMVRQVDPDRLVTASHGGDIGLDELRAYLQDVEVDFIAPHRPRDAGSPAQTEAQTRDYLAAMRKLGRVVPVHYQEPFRRGYDGRWQPSADDYSTDLAQARAGGAAGWCFHNGDQRGAADGRPRRSFDLRQHSLFEQLDAEELRFIERLPRGD